MKNIRPVLLSLAFVGIFGGCKSLKWTATGPTVKAEELKKSGAAGDMAEAQKMADDHYWIENARSKEDAERLKRAEAAAKK